MAGIRGCCSPTGRRAPGSRAGSASVPWVVVGGVGNRRPGHPSFPTPPCPPGTLGQDGRLEEREAEVNGSN